jgi:polyhydroxybutyrate depolymerase
LNAIKSIVEILVLTGKKMKNIMGVLAFFAISYSNIAVAQNANNLTDVPLAVNNKNNIVRGMENRNFGRFVGETKNLRTQIRGEVRKFIEYSATDVNKVTDYTNKDLIIVLHGEKGSAERMKSQTIFADLAKSNNLVVVFPESIDHLWNDGRIGYSADKDVLFIKEIVEKYKKLGVKKVMVTGFSNGAILSLRLACENIPHLNYFGAVAGSLPENLDCKSSTGKNILVMNGTDDNFILWEGGMIANNEKVAGNGRLLPVEETVKSFATNNSCIAAKPQTIDINFNDRSSVDKYYYQCKKGNLLFYKIEGGGHTLPGGRNRATLSNMIGNTNRDISAERELIDFLKK